MVGRVAEYGLQFHHSGVSPELHESATIDGANILQRILHIDIPTIMPTMVILLIMALGNVMNVGYEKVYLMQNDMTLDVSEVISTYVYKIGLKNQQFSFSSAIGLFNNVINFIIMALVVFCIVKFLNKLRKPATKTPAEPTTKKCPYCMSEISIAATRCPNCTSSLIDVDTKELS